ncbi:MAG: TonB-dependent receptor [Thermodesulfobacteriota bacterium]
MHCLKNVLRCFRKIMAGALIGHQMLFASPGRAAEPVSHGATAGGVLPEITVSGGKIITPTRQPGETVFTGSEVTAQGIEMQGARAATSVYGAVDILPGIHVESADSNGLAAETNNVRVRGVRTILGALTVEGVPNYGGNPIGPRDYLYDLENMRGISVYKGAVPGDIGTGVGSRGGAVELRPDWPHDNAGYRFSQSFGSNDYSRTFLRLDSGSISPAGTRVSGSVSYTDADKWRGPGSLGPRKNANLALEQPVGDRLSARLWFNHNDLEQHLYRPLTATDIQNLKENHAKDYNAAPTGVAAQDIYYYDYNRGSYRNDDLLTVLSLKVSPAWRLNVKPYHAVEDTEILQGTTSGGGRIEKRTRDIDRTGVIGEAILEAGAVRTVVGHHFEASDMNIFTRNYAVTAGGLDYRGYGVLASSGTGYINSPYLKVAGHREGVDWQAGMKYFHFKDAASEGYTTGPAPDYALVRATDLDRESTIYDIWLPSLGAAWNLTDDIQFHGSYGRNFIRPYSYIPLINLYNTNRAAFQAQGITLQQLFDGYAIERSDTVDLGVRYSGGWFDLAPTLFCGKHKNLLVTVHDPRVNLNYQQNVGRATGYGLDLEMNAYLGSELTLFVNPTWTRLTYDGDLTYAGSRLAADGNQVVDTPEWLLKSGLIYRPGNFEIVPMLRLLGTRYADVEHKGEVGSAVVADLRMGYTLSRVLAAESVKIALDLTNLFDKKYVSVINASDDTRNGVATYHPGAPFAAMLSMTMSY